MDTSMMSDSVSFSIGQRVEVTGRDVIGTVAFIGTTSFAAGKWIGVVLDEPKGKNNGTFQGTVYFEAPENHGLFVRQSQLLPVDGGTAKKTSIPAPATKTSPPKSNLDDSKHTSKQSRSSKPMSQAQRRTQLTRIPGFGFMADSALPTSQHALSSGLKTSLPVTPEFGSCSSPKFTGASKSTISKIKGTIFTFSSPVKPSPPTYLPGPSKSFSGTGTPNFGYQNNALMAQMPRSATISGTPGFSGLKPPLPVVNSAGSTITWRPRMNSAQSSPRLNSISSASKLQPTPSSSFRELKHLKISSPNLRTTESRLALSSQVPVATANWKCRGDGKAKASASHDDITQLSTYLSTRMEESINTPPSKPPRPSLLRAVSTLSASTEALTTFNYTPPGYSSPMSSNVRGDCSANLTGDGTANGISPTVVGIYNKRRRRISELKSSPVLAFGTRATEYRICRKLATSCPSSDSTLRSEKSSATSNSLVITNDGSDCKIRFSTQSMKPSRLVKRNFFMRLPIAGALTKESPKSLQTSPSGSSISLATPTAIATATKADSNTSKRKSFVETIAEPIVTHYTQGPLFTPTMTPSSTGEDRFGAMQTTEALRNEVKDLHEKLEVLKAKRAADQDKLRDLDRLKLQVETLVEFKTKVLENQGTLQKDLKKAKQDARDAIDAKERHAEEMAELSEAVEMATLDKEMAEEKSETLQMELEQANEKIAQLTTELTAIKDELSGNIDPDLNAANSVQMKQLHAENTRMREALVKLRDTTAHDKHQHQKLAKEVETQKNEVVELSKTKERLEKRCEELETQILDLQEMNDAALGAEEMVVNLTEKNLDLEEKVAQLAEAVADLEALQDVNEQLQESARELEMELRDESYRVAAANSNITREKEALIETLSDRETTIVRFRELVQKLRDENDILRKNLEEESSKSIPVLPEALDFKKIFAETKAQTTAIDLELRRLEAKEAVLHTTYLSSYMPDGFMKRGGDNDALLVLLLVPRMICKVELLLSQVRDKLVPASFAGGTQQDEIASLPDVERYSFACQFSYLLYALLSELHRWSTALNSCSTDDFLSVGLLFTDLSVQERGLDFYLELLRKSQLDENIPLDGLEKCISSFQNFYTIHLGEEQIVPATLVSDVCLASAAASDCLIVDVARIIHIMNKNSQGSNMGGLLQDVKTIGESLRQLSKRTRRYLPDPPKQPPVSTKLQSQLLNDAMTLTKLVKVFQQACKQAVNHADMVTPTAAEGIPSSKVEEYFQSAMENCDTRVEGAGGFKEVVKEWLTGALMTMTDLAQVVNEAPVVPKEKPPSPLSLRAQAVKAELDQSRNLRIQLEDKETTINELRKLIRAKQEEFSEANIRKELAEKKLSNATKDSDMTIEKLNRKLEDSQTNLQRKEREFQATMDHFQSEIEAIENEKGELKEKLMSASKRRLLEGIAQSAGSSPISGPTLTISASHALVPTQSSSISSEVMPSPGLIEYTRHLQRQNWKLRAGKVLSLVRSWEPIKLPKKEDYEDVRQIQKDFWKIKHEANGLLCEELRVKFNEGLTSGRKRILMDRINLKRSQLNPKIADLGERIDALLAEKKEFLFIKTDFATFSSLSHLTPQGENTETLKVGMIRFPGWEKSTEEPTRVVLSPEQLQRIHDLLAPIG